MLNCRSTEEQGNFTFESYLKVAEEPDTKNQRLNFHDQSRVDRCVQILKGRNSLAVYSNAGSGYGKDFG